MSASLSDHDEDGITGINVTPLVDIMLVLLIVFMVTAVYMVQPSIDLSLPHSASAGEAAPSTLALALTRDGHLFLNGDPVSEAEAASRCRDLLARQPDLTAIVAVDAEARHGDTVRLLDLVQGAGARHLAISVAPAVPETPAKLALAR